MKDEQNGTPDQIQTFVFLDLETSGFDDKPRISEISMIAISRNDLLNMKSQDCSPWKKNENTSNSMDGKATMSLPRVLHKYTRLFYPQKLICPQVENITGLSNDMLDHLPSFSKETVEAINLFLNFPSPVCMIAHNGISYDFQILKAEMMDVGLDILNNVVCADSLLFVRKHEREEIELLKTFAQNFDDWESDEEINLPSKQLKFSDTETDGSGAKGDTDILTVTKTLLKTPQKSTNSSNLKKKPENSNENLKDDSPAPNIDGLSVTQPILKTPEKNIYINNIEDQPKAPTKNLKGDSPAPSADRRSVTKAILETPDKNVYNNNIKEELKTPEKKFYNNNIKEEPKTPDKNSNQNPKDNFSTPKTQNLNGLEKSTPSTSTAKKKRCDRVISKESKPFSQPNLYHRLFNAHYNSHRAESDTVALMQICAHYGDNFVQWADKNFVTFQSIKPRWSPRKTFTLRAKMV